MHLRFFNLFELKGIKISLKVDGSLFKKNLLTNSYILESTKSSNLSMFNLPKIGSVWALYLEFVIILTAFFCSFAILSNFFEEFEPHAMQAYSRWHLIKEL